MLRSFVLASIVTLTLTSLPAAGMKAELYPLPNDTLSFAAAKLRGREYKVAFNLAETAPASGARDFIAGVAAFRANEWQDAARYLSSSTKSFSMLADYSLYFQAQALNNLNRPDDALIPLQVIQKNHRESPTHRPAVLLIAEIQYARKDYPAALVAYQKFIESYPSGRDSLFAQQRLALCREAMGDATSAVKILRNLWLTSPASPLASKTEEELKRIASTGVPAASYTADELYHRGVTLLELKKFSAAVTAFKAVPREGQSREFVTRLDLKNGQALYRSRHYKEAEQIFSRISSIESASTIAAEATYWLARCKDRNDQHDEAVSKFLQVADRWPKADESDNALLEAAYIRKSQKRWGEVRINIQRLLSSYPETTLKPLAWWEGGWSAYQSGDWQTASYYLRKLAENNEYRDKALYWLSRSEAASGNRVDAESIYASLVREFPLSYYSLISRQEQKGEEGSPSFDPQNGLPRLGNETIGTLPLPPNFLRVKALISCGLNDEARKELAAFKGKSTDTAKLLGAARLYLEMDDFNGAYNLVRREPTRLSLKEGRQTLALQFQLPFFETANRYADAHGLPLPLVYAVIRAESSFSPVAVSPVGAVGLMQLMPATAAQIEGAGKEGNLTDRLTLPEKNISYGTKHMKDLILMYNADLISVIASYNAGAGAVNRWRRDFGTFPSAEFIEQIPYGETREYVKQVLASTAIYAQLYNLPLKGTKIPLPAKP